MEIALIREYIKDNHYDELCNLIERLHCELITQENHRTTANAPWLNICGKTSKRGENEAQNKKLPEHCCYCSPQSLDGHNTQKV
ncbi:hypothetical protein KAT51_07645, partial [bacterium]|nr:hypothetical protein [bacterium]